MFAQSQNGLLGSEWPVELVVFPVAHSTEQDGVCLGGELERAVGKRVTMSIVRSAAHRSFFHLELQVEIFQNLDSFSDDFCTDAITGKNCNFHDRNRGEGGGLSK